MQFIGDYQIDPALCDRLVALHKAAARRGLVVRGRVGKGMGAEVDEAMKDSYDLGLVRVPEQMQEKYGVPQFYQALKACVDRYIETHPVLRNVDPFHLAESPIIQHYRPGGGFKFVHFERTGAATALRMLTWLTYLNDVTDGGGTHFVYQDLTVEARKGRTLIWPPDFTHTHVGVVSPTQDKYIITGWLSYMA